MRPATLLVLQSPAGEPAFNMALDEALLESASRLGGPIHRFYSWSQPAASFGYFQHYAEVERLTSFRPLVRRPTGGGLVPHDRDWTYSLVFPPAHPWYSFAAIESYRQVHEWIQGAFDKMNVTTELAPETRKAGAGQCFAGYEKWDLLWHGTKIAGAAQRRTKQGLLIQGSIQPPPLSLKRERWESDMLETVLDEVAKNWKKMELEDSLLRRAQELERTKYSQKAYNEKR